MKRFVLFLILVIFPFLLFNYQSTGHTNSDSILSSKASKFIKDIGGSPLYSDINNNVLNTIFKTKDSISLLTMSNTPGYEIEKCFKICTVDCSESLVYKKVSYYGYTYICLLINNKDILALTSKIRIKALVDNNIEIYENPIVGSIGTVISINASNIDVFEIGLLDNNDNDIYLKFYK